MMHTPPASHLHVRSDVLPVRDSRFCRGIRALLSDARATTRFTSTFVHGERLAAGNVPRSAPVGTALARRKTPQRSRTYADGIKHGCAAHYNQLHSCDFQPGIRSCCLRNVHRTFLTWRI